MAPNVGLGTQGPEQRGWSLWLASVLGVLIAGLFVCGRLLQRWMKLGVLGLDDYMIAASLVASALLSVTECQAVVYGYGRKYASLPHDKRMTARKWFYGAQIMYKIVPTLTKVSIVCLYYRLFAVATNSFRTICHVANAFIISAGLAFTIGTIFQCTPIAAFWDRSIKPARCFKNEPWWISFSVIQIFTDVALLIIPIRQIFTLSMTRTEKIGLSVVFGTGFFVTFASIYRATTLASSAKDPDPTWGPIPATVWSVIEVNAGIVCACLPMLRHPFLKIFGPLLGSNRTKTKQQSYRLTSRERSQPQRSGLASKNRDLQLTEFDRDSEENIISPGNEAYGVHEAKQNGLDRSKSAIYVKSEFTVRTSNNETQKVTRSKKETDEKSGAGSVNDEKPDSKDTFFHI